MSAPRRIASVAALALAAIAPASTSRAAVGTWSSGGPGERIHALSVSPRNDQQVLAAGETGVWRTSDGGGTWQRLAEAHVRVALAYDSQDPSTVYAVGADAKSLLKSADGGATWTTVYSAPSSYAQFYDLVADPIAGGIVYASLAGTDNLAEVLRSDDAGVTWTAALPADVRGMGSPGGAAATGLTAPAGSPGTLVAGVRVYHGGGLLVSPDRGRTWRPAPNGGLTPLAGPGAVAATGSSGGSLTIYAAYSVVGISRLVRSDDGGTTWSDISGGLPNGGHGFLGALVAHPVRPDWLYARFVPTSPSGSTTVPASGGVYASADRGQTWTEVGRLSAAVNGQRGLALAVPSRTLFAATDTGVQQVTIAWPVLAQFAPYYETHDGYRLLGTAISLRADEDGRTVQYFEKGRLEDHTSDTSNTGDTGETPDPNWALMYGLLVDELHAREVDLPVGGDVSSLTYAGLHRLADAAVRVPLPAGYAGSGTTAASDGGTFVPFTTDLSGAPGHVVPARFWEYVNRTDLFPGGWLHDVGLPITAATPVHVTKYLPDGPVQRTITVQAFQRTILTEDPANPPDWQVERANTGSDYRKTFPERVGP